MTTIRLIAPGQPVSAKNHKRGFVVTTKTGHQRAAVARSKAIIAWYARVVPVLARQFAALDLRQIRRPVHVETHQYLKHEVLSKANPDADGVVSGVYDALVKAFVLEDDRFVVTYGGSRQQDAANPRVEIEITVVDWPGA